MESALADAASALSVALKMCSCMVYTDLRPVPICASVANRERRSHDDARSSKQLPRSPGHVTSSQLIAYACHNHSIMISCKHGTFWRGSRAWIAGPRGFSNGNAYIFDRWRLPDDPAQILAALTHVRWHIMAYAACRSALGSQIGRKRPPRSRQCASSRVPTIQ